MKKIITIMSLVLTAYAVKAQQRASFKNDTARYNKLIYVVGDTIKLGYGSQPDKSFAYISIGTSPTALTDMDKTYANKTAIIEKISLQRKTMYLNARIIEKTVDTPTVKILIDLEAAVDDKEIK